MTLQQMVIDMDIVGQEVQVNFLWSERVQDRSQKDVNHSYSWVMELCVF